MTHLPNLPVNSISPLPVSSVDADESTLTLVKIMAEAADDRKAADVIALKVSEVCYLTDYFLLATGFSRPQVKAIADAIEEKVSQNFQRDPCRVEGKTEASWILLDYGEVIVHVFLPEEREFYNLEAFWSHAERFDLSNLNVLIDDEGYF